MNLYFYRAIVVSIYDGDTIRVNIDLGFNTWIFNVKLRLFGIDTPELRGDEREQGLAAKKFVEDRIPVGQEIRVATVKDSTGKFGRYLATIYYGDNFANNLNEGLIKERLAVIYNP